MQLAGKCDVFLNFSNPKFYVAGLLVLELLMLNFSILYHGSFYYY